MHVDGCRCLHRTCHVQGLSRPTALEDLRVDRAKKSSPLDDPMIHSELPPFFRPSPVCGLPVSHGHHGGLKGGGVDCSAFAGATGCAQGPADEEEDEFCMDVGKGGLNAGWRISAGHAPFGGGACASAAAGGGGLELSTVGGALFGGLLVGRLGLGRGGG